MKKSFLLKSAILLTTSGTLDTSLKPLTIFAAENHETGESMVHSSTQSDIKEQFGLTSNEWNAVARKQNFIPTSKQIKQIDALLNKKQSTRVFGIDDVLKLIALAGAGYAASH